MGFLTAKRQVELAMTTDHMKEIVDNNLKLQASIRHETDSILSFCLSINEADYSHDVCFQADCYSYSYAMYLLHHLYSFIQVCNVTLTVDGVEVPY